MKKCNHCNIIKDLLPLYIEDICSEESKQYVEEHLAQCPQCRDTCALLKQNDLTAEAAMTREINAFKKLQAYYNRKIGISYPLFFFLLLIMIWGLFLLFQVPHMSHIWYYALMPILMLATALTFGYQKHDTSCKKMGKGWFIAQTLLLIYSIFIMFYTCLSLQRGNTPFGLAPHRTGPFLAVQFQAIIVLSLLFFVFYLYQTARKKRYYTAAINITILCIFLPLTYLTTLHYMSDFESLYQILLTSTCILCVIALLPSLIFRLLQHKK